MVTDRLTDWQTDGRTDICVSWAAFAAENKKTFWVQLFGIKKGSRMVLLLWVFWNWPVLGFEGISLLIFVQSSQSWTFLESLLQGQSKNGITFDSSPRHIVINELLKLFLRKFVIHPLQNPCLINFLGKKCLLKFKIGKEWSVLNYKTHVWPTFLGKSAF